MFIILPEDKVGFVIGLPFRKFFEGLDGVSQKLMTSVLEKCSFSEETTKLIPQGSE